MLSIYLFHNKWLREFTCLSHGINWCVLCRCGLCGEYLLDGCFTYTKHSDPSIGASIYVYVAGAWLNDIYLNYPTALTLRFWRKGLHGLHSKWSAHCRIAAAHWFGFCVCVCLEKSDRDASEFISHVHCLLAIQSRIQSGLYFLRIQTSRVCFGFINSRRKSKTEECPNFRYRLQRECVRICNIGRRSCAQHSQGMQSRPFDVVRMLSIYQSKKSDKNIAQP